MATRNGNGTIDGAPPGATLLQIPRREAWVELPQEYPGFQVRLWLNYPRGLLSELRSGEEQRVAAALSQIVLEHNGWADYDGSPFPPPTDPTFWEKIPDELAAVIIALLNVETTKLPNSLTPTNRR